MSVALLSYKLASGTSGVTVPVATWTTVPFNVEEYDTGGDITLNGDGSFRPVVGDYRIRGAINLSGSPTNNAFSGFSFRFLRLAATVITTVLGTTTRSKGATASSDREVSLMDVKGRFSTVGGLDFALQVFLNAGTSCNIGLPATNASLSEIYAEVEILKE